MKDLSILEQYRQHNDELRIYGFNGDSGNGVFKVYINGKSFFCIASNGGGWDHVSITRCRNDRCPTWEEMCAIKNMFFNPDETVIQYHPAKSNYVNVSQYCLHLWRPSDGKIPMPPVGYV